MPILGSLSVLWGLLRRVPLPELLRRLRVRYGPLFLIRTGPVSQVWVGDPDVLRRVYELPECSGRPVSFKDPFGDFLFLVREPGPAEVIRERQTAWLDANLRADAIGASTEEAMSRLWPLLDGPEPRAWPGTAVRTAMYSAVTTALLGRECVVSDAELEMLMAATTEYSEMRAKGKFGKRGARKGQLPPGATDIRRIIGGALARAGRTDSELALPLVVAASVGGAEIFPTLLQWIALDLAQRPAEQEEAARAAASGDNAALMRCIYAVLRRTAYSVALGPPRKILADAVVDGVQLPAGALLFAMHPALVDSALGRAPPADEDFASYAFGVGPRACLGRKLAEALLPAALGALLHRYSIALADPAGSNTVRGELQGQLIRPVDAPALKWEVRGA